MFKYFPHTDKDLEEMLGVIGVKSLDDLYAEVPAELKLKGQLNLPSSKSEQELRAIFKDLIAANRPLVCFAGAGAYDHYTPSVMPYLASRSEFSTSYTPYQAEISQGTLQYIFEYQSMMAELTGLDISNASMYDGSTATAEAMMMCVHSAKKKNTILLSDTFAPQVKDVVETYAKFHGINLEIVPAKNGLTDKAAIEARLSQGDVAGVLVPQPNYFGLIDDFSGLADAVHAAKALLVINAPASTLGVLKTPGEWGADIACGDAQSLGLPPLLRRPLYRLSVHAQGARSQNARPPRGRHARRRRTPLLRAHAAGSRTTYPPRKSHFEHLHRAGHDVSLRGHLLEPHGQEGIARSERTKLHEGARPARRPARHRQIRTRVRRALPQ